MAKQILIVEDLPDFRRILYLTLSPVGYNIIEATTGEEGIEKAETYLPDLIIMDLGMPAMNGIETTLKLKRNPKTADIPIIAYTVWGDEWKEKALEAGMTDFFSKTTSPQELRGIIQKFFPTNR